MTETRDSPDGSGRVLIGLSGPKLESRDREALRHPATGGVVLFTRNFEHRDQLKSLTAAIRDSAGRDLLITVDHEGGRVQRFREGFTRLPPLAVLGRVHADHPERALDLAYRHGRVMATELLLCGVDQSFAPVLDINGASQVIGDRAFAEAPAVIKALGAHYLAGMHDAGMRTCGKHFPGHGSVAADSHTDDASDGRPLEQIEAQDIEPFRALLGGLDSMMMAHVVYPAVAPEPAGYSSFWVRDYLRGKLGFQGLVLSDDLGMHAAACAGKLPERMWRSLEAGCDAVLVCDPDEVTALYENLGNDAFETGAQPLSALRGHNPHSEAELATVGEWTHWQRSLETLEKTKWA